MRALLKRVRRFLRPRREPVQAYAVVRPFPERAVLRTGKPKETR